MEQTSENKLNDELGEPITFTDVWKINWKHWKTIPKQGEVSIGQSCVSILKGIGAVMFGLFLVSLR